MRRLERVVTLAENELLKLKDNLKLTQEILPRDSPRPKPDNTNLIRKLPFLEDMFERVVASSYPLSGTSSDEYLKTISERTEIDVTCEPLVFNINVLPCSNYPKQCNLGPCEKLKKSEPKTVDQVTSNAIEQASKAFNESFSELLRTALESSRDSSSSELTHLTHLTHLSVEKINKPITYVPPKRKPLARSHVQCKSPDTLSKHQKSVTMDPASTTADMNKMSLKRSSTRFPTHLNSSFSRKHSKGSLFKSTSTISKSKSIVKSEQQNSITSQSIKNSFSDHQEPSTKEMSTKTDKNEQIKCIKNKKPLDDVVSAELNYAYQDHLPGKFPEEQKMTKQSPATKKKNPEPLIQKATSKSRVEPKKNVRSDKKVPEISAKTKNDNAQTTQVYNHNQTQETIPSIPQYCTPTSDIVKLAKNAMKNIDDMKITDSCNHLQFKYIDSNQVIQPTKIEVYIAKNPESQDGRPPRRKPVTRNGAPCNCSPTKKPNANVTRVACPMRPKPSNMCSDPLNTDLSPSEGPEVRRRRILEKCVVQTLPGVCIKKDFVNQQVLNLDTNTMCDCKENKNTFFECHDSEEKEGSPEDSIASTVSRTMVRILSCEGPEQTQEAKKNQSKPPGCDTGCDSYSSPPIKNLTVSKASSPIPCDCVDCSVQSKPTQRQQSVETVLCTDIPSRRVCLHNEVIETIMEQRDIVSTTDVTSDSCLSKCACAKQNVCFCNKPEMVVEEIIDEKPARQVQSCGCMKNKVKVDDAEPAKISQKKVSISEYVQECKLSKTCESCEELLQRTASKEKICVPKKTCDDCEEEVKKEKKKEKEKPEEYKPCTPKACEDCYLPQKSSKSSLVVSCIDKECIPNKSCAVCQHPTRSKEVEKKKQNKKKTEECNCEDPKKLKKPCKAECEITSNCTEFKKEKRRNETPEKTGCCKCCKKKKKCENLKCTSAICRIQEQEQVKCHGILCHENKSTTECGSSNCNSRTESNVSVDIITCKNDKCRAHDNNSTAMRKNCIQVAYCTIDNPIKNGFYPKKASDDISIPTSTEKYILVHDVSAQAEDLTDLDDFNMSFSSFMGCGSLKKTTSLDDFLSIRGSVSPNSGVRDTQPLKVTVDPFNGQFRNEVQQRRGSQILQEVSHPGTSSNLVDDRKSEPEKQLLKVNSIGFPKKRNETVSKTKHCDWKLMRRNKAKESHVARAHKLHRLRRATDSTSSEGEVDCNCSVSVGEVHNCEPPKQNGRKLEKLRKQPDGGIHVAGRHRHSNKNIVSYYISNS